MTKIPKTWDHKIRKICDLPNDITVWTCAMWGWDFAPKYEYKRYGTCIAVFRGEGTLESAMTNYDNSINSSIYHMAMSDAKRLAKDNYLQTHSTP